MLMKVKDFCKAHVTDFFFDILKVTGASVVVISLIMFGHIAPYIV